MPTVTVQAFVCRKRYSVLELHVRSGLYRLHAGAEGDVGLPVTSSSVRINAECTPYHPVVKQLFPYVFPVKQFVQPDFQVPVPDFKQVCKVQFHGFI
jgi:hypothetical protein